MTFEDRLKEYLLYDPTSGFLFWKKSKSRSIFVGKEAGNLTQRGYKTFRFDKKVYKTHRVCWFLYYGNWPKGEVDHINGLKDDNRISNLRDVSHRENMLNKKSQSGSTSKYKGVYWHKSNKKWRATLWNGSSKLHLGMFDCETSAALAYDEAAKQVFGEFARLNFGGTCLVSS